jgi:DNA-binding transcriptional ArsR family regulator
MPGAKLDAFDARSVELSRFARALAHPARIAIVRLLDRRGELPCMAVVAALPLSQPACSRHVSELREAGLVRAREDGSRVWLSLDRRRLGSFCRSLGKALSPAPR